MLVAAFILYRTRLIDSTEVQAVVSVIGGLLAAYFGAAAAIRFQRSIEAGRKQEELVGFVNQTIFLIADRVNFLWAIKKQGLVPYLDDSLRHIKILPLILPYPEEKMKKESMVAALGLENASLVQQLGMLETEFFAIIEVIDRRNKIHQEMQSRLAAAGIRQPYQGPRKGFDAAAGYEIITQLESLTDQLFIAVDDYLSSSKEDVQRLRVAGKARFPNSVILNTRMPE